MIKSRLSTVLCSLRNSNIAREDAHCSFAYFLRMLEDNCIGKQWSMPQCWLTYSSLLFFFPSLLSGSIQCVFNFEYFVFVCLFASNGMQNTIEWTNCLPWLLWMSLTSTILHLGTNPPSRHSRTHFIINVEQKLNRWNCLNMKPFSYDWSQHIYCAVRVQRQIPARINQNKHNKYVFRYMASNFIRIYEPNRFRLCFVNLLFVLCKYGLNHLTSASVCHRMAAPNCCFSVKSNTDRMEISWLLSSSSLSHHHTRWKKQHTLKVRWQTCAGLCFCWILLALKWKF